jgi:multiple sugar transport system substrate-binding protein
MYRRTIFLTLVVSLLLILSGAASAQGDNVTIEWWSHWANEPAKVAVIEKIASDYMAENPNVTINITWWDKQPLRDAVRSSMTAGEGAPDIVTFGSDQFDWVQAGWLVDLSDALPWEKFVSGTELDGNYSAQGMEGNYKLDVGITTQMLFYNSDIFAELGIDVPEDYQFTPDEFTDVISTCNQAGYAGIADAIGNRNYPGVWPVQYLLWTLVGPEQFDLYNSGQQSWDTQAARRVLDQTVTWRDAGLWPATLSTMTIDEFHIYFHTQRKACMMYIPSWYSGRAFAPQEQGGQDPNWHFGMLRYPAWEDGAADQTLWGGFEDGYAVLSSSEHIDTAEDILTFTAQPQYGALWTAVTNIPSSVIYDPATDWPSDETLTELGVVPGQWDWFWAEYAKVYGGLPSAVATTPACGDFADAVVSALNEGLPLGLMSVDEAVDTLDNALCTS